MKNTYKKKLTIPSYYIDNTKKLSLPASMGIIQDITSEHSDLLKIDRWSMLSSCGAFWVTTKVKVIINKMPELNDVVTAETWTIDNSKVKFERDCVIKNKTENLVCFKTEWVALDEKTMRLRPAKTISFPFKMKNRKDRAIDKDFSTFNYEITENDFCYSRIIFSSDIDVNNHVNNCFYTRFVLDAFSTSELKQQIKEYEIHFVNQCFEGEKLDFYKLKTDNGFYVEAKSNNKVIIKAQLIF